MSRRVTSVVLAAATLMAVACSESPESNPESLTAPTLARGGKPNREGCNFKTIQQAAIKYFGSGDQQAALATIRLMEDEYGAGMFGTADDLAFDVMSLVEVVANGGTEQGKPSDGGKLTSALFKCTSHKDDAALSDLSAFTAALSDFGAYGVRGAEPISTPVLAKNLSPLWGVEPQQGYDWEASTVAPEVLIFGAPTGDFDTDEDLVGTAFEWNVLPDGPVDFAPRVVVGVCLTDDLLRVERLGQILPEVEPTFCPENLASADGESGWMTAARDVLQFATAVFAPEPLHAAALLARTGIGGTAGGFTPFGAIDAGTVVTSFALQPHDAFVGENAGPVEVLVTGTGGTPWEGVLITLVVQLNNGSWVEITQQDLDTPLDPVITNEDGIARFGSIVLNKPGGYRLVAVPAEPGFTPEPEVSVAFHIKFP